MVFKNIIFQTSLIKLQRQVSQYQKNMIRAQYVSSGLIRGLSFQGEVFLSRAHGLTFKIKQNETDTRYEGRVTDEDIMRDPKNYQIMRSVDILQEELMSNSRLRIQGDLLKVTVSIQYQYEDEYIQVDVPIRRVDEERHSPLANRMPSDYQERLLQQDIQPPREQMIEGRPGSEQRVVPILNQPFNRKFSIENVKLIMGNSRAHALTDLAQFSHTLPLDPPHTYLFKVKLIKTAQRDVQVGFITKKIGKRSYSSCVYSLRDGRVQYEQKVIESGYDVSRVRKGSAITAKVDTSAGVVEWRHGKQTMCQVELSSNNDRGEIRPTLRMRTAGDQVQFIGK